MVARLAAVCKHLFGLDNERTYVASLAAGTCVRGRRSPYPTPGARWRMLRNFLRAHAFVVTPRVEDGVMALALSQQLPHQPALHLVAPPKSAPYWRRRLVAAAALAVLGWACLEVTLALGSAFVDDPVAQSSVGVPGGPYVTRLAQPGDSYWSIVAGSDVTGDPRAAVDALLRLNRGAAMRAGEPVLVPQAWVRR